jgi:hypothetical protein
LISFHGKGDEGKPDGDTDELIDASKVVVIAKSPNGTKSNHACPMTARGY